MLSTYSSDELKKMARQALKRGQKMAGWNLLVWNDGVRLEVRYTTKTGYGAIQVRL